VLCNYGSGDKAKVERLRQSKLKTGRVLAATDFTKKPESDIENLLSTDLYLKLVNKALGLSGEAAIKAGTISAVRMPRIVKQVEAVCKTLPADIPEFNHYLPAECLLRHPEFLDGKELAVTQSLDMFERVFTELNRFLD